MQITISHIIFYYLNLHVRHFPADKDAFGFVVELREIDLSNAVSVL